MEEAEADCDYFDLNSLLSEEELIPVTFRLDVKGVGQLESSFRGIASETSKENEDIEAGTSVELPFWLVKPLLKSITVDVNMPLSYEKCQGNLKAEPTSVSLSNLPNFYTIGFQLSKWLQDPTFKDILVSSFEERYKDILIKCQNMRDTDLTATTRALAQTEKALFNTGYHSAIQFDKWRSDNGSTTLQKSSLLRVGGGVQMALTNNNAPPLKRKQRDF